MNNYFGILQPLAPPTSCQKEKTLVSEQVKLQSWRAVTAVVQSLHTLKNGFLLSGHDIALAKGGCSAAVYGSACSDVICALVDLICTCKCKDTLLVINDSDMAS